VDPYLTIADIGSDHAYLPVWLVKNKKISFAVAGEIKPGPLEAARRTIHEAALENNIAVRLGDGLQVVEPGEVEVAVIAGMGGAAIQRVLEQSPMVLACLRRIICQPMTGAASLRAWLIENNWQIISEELILEDGRLYEVIAAEHGQSQPVDQLLLEIGPLLWQQRHPLLTEHLYRLIRQYEERVAAMANSRSEKVKERRRAFQEIINALEAKMTCLQAVE
jgi:tRNA (adenine22-N1)-methyltransferase